MNTRISVYVSVYVVRDAHSVRGPDTKTTGET